MNKFSKMAAMLLVAVSLVMLACTTTKKSGVTTLRFARQGGGNLEFVAQLNATADTMQVSVSSIDFRDTVITGTILRDKDNAELFDVINLLTVNKVTDKVVIAKEVESKANTRCVSGTWTHFYLEIDDQMKADNSALSDLGEVEVTSKRIKTKLEPLEDLVRNKICDEE